MTTRPLTFAACTAALTLFVAASPAQAQEATLFPHEMRGVYGITEAAPESDSTAQRIVVTGRRTDREAVVAAVMQAAADGTLDRSGEAQPARLSDGSFIFTRAEVVAELFKAKAEGRFDSSGEHWIGHDHGGRDPSFAVAASTRRPVILAAQR